MAKTSIIWFYQAIGWSHWEASRWSKYQAEFSW
jgi:hypothetical protein